VSSQGEASSIVKEQAIKLRFFMEPAQPFAWALKFVFFMSFHGVAPMVAGLDSQGSCRLGCVCPKRTNIRDNHTVTARITSRSNPCEEDETVILMSGGEGLSLTTWRVIGQNALQVRKTDTHTCNG
jgi:hypothetical protein